MSVLGQGQPSEDVVLVFRPPENPAAQIAGITPFKSLRLRLDELLDWFKDLHVDSIDLWIEGAYKSGNRIELFLSVEGKTGARLTLRPFAKTGQAIIAPEKVEVPPIVADSKSASKGTEGTAKPEKPPPQPVTALFSPAGGIERHIVSLIDSAIGSIEVAAFRLTNLYIEKGLMEAIKRGVKVALIMDRSETLGRQAKIHDNLERAGSDVRLITPKRGIMHDKYIIVDGKTVQWGSYNYTERAESANFENATFVTDSILAGQYHSDFASMFNRAKPESRGSLRPFARFVRRLVKKPDPE